MVVRHKVGGAKFRGRKRHATEYCAGVVVLGGYAYLVGNAILGRAYKILRGAHESYHGEQSEGYGEVSVVTVAKLIVKSSADDLRYVTAAATAATAIVLRLSYLGVEYYRVNCFYCCPLIGVFAPYSSE